jgi:hypothetical protein
MQDIHKKEIKNKKVKTQMKLKTTELNNSNGLLYLDLSEKKRIAKGG